MLKRLYIMRGLPGSGKSTIAKELAGNLGQCFATDDYWYIEDGSYQFNIDKLKEAHAWNVRRVEQAIESELPIIVIDNCNTKLEYLKNYALIIEAALLKDYYVEIIPANSLWAFDINELVLKNTHLVPREIIQKMADEWKEFTIDDILRK